MYAFDGQSLVPPPSISQWLYWTKLKAAKVDADRSLNIEMQPSSQRHERNGSRLQAVPAKLH